MVCLVPSGVCESLNIPRVRESNTIVCLRPVGPQPFDPGGLQPFDGSLTVRQPEPVRSACLLTASGCEESHKSGAPARRGRAAESGFQHGGRR